MWKISSWVVTCHRRIPRMLFRQHVKAFTAHIDINILTHKWQLTLPKHRESNNADRCQFYDVTKRRWLHCRVRPTFPAHNVTCQLTYFWRVTTVAVFHGHNHCWGWFRHRYAAFCIFHYLSWHTYMYSSYQHKRTVYCYDVLIHVTMVACVH